MEELWNNILSRNPNKIISTYSILSEQDKINVLNHLTKMVTEDGWQPGQILSADTALKIIDLHATDYKENDSLT